MDDSLPLHPHDETRLVVSPHSPVLPTEPQAQPQLPTEPQLPAEPQTPTQLDPATNSHSSLGSQIPSYPSTSTIGTTSQSKVTPTSQSHTISLSGSSSLPTTSTSHPSAATVGAAVPVTIIAVVAIIATTIFVHRRRRRRRQEAEKSAEIKAFPGTDGDGDIISPSEPPALAPTPWPVTVKRAPEPSAPPPRDIVSALQEENALLRAVVAQIQSGQDSETLPSYESRSVGSESDTSHTATIRSVE